MSDHSHAAASTTYLVEHYWPGITADLFRSASDRVRATAEEMARTGAPIRYLHSTMIPVDEAAFCVLDASSADLVEQLYARAGLRFDRIVTALEI
jgi:Nickel responsive protein SCO4226-like